jgi:ATP-dependent DNA helicase DinG
MVASPGAGPGRILMPTADALALTASGAIVMTAEGELVELDAAGLARRLDGPRLMLCHARAVARRAGRDSLAAFDLLELFAFVHPARFCLPTPRGLAAVLELPVPVSPEDGPATLLAAARALLRQVGQRGREDGSDAAGIAWTMAKGGWPWGPLVLAALGAPAGPGDAAAERALKVWRGLPEWGQDAPSGQPGQLPVEPAEARERLARMLGRGAEARPEQADYASAASLAFTPREGPHAPNLVLAEAGTGVGKTLGYLAPATLWAERNKAPVWVSTFTRNLQRQIDQEMDRLHANAEVKARKVVIRKGRENYLCLLNLEDAVRALLVRPQNAVAIGLMARWTAATRDGDMTGGDFPGWLADLVGRGRSLGLSDRRGECIHSACDHHSRCFIERSVRRARRAEIVIANHALVMIQAALGGMDDAWLPTRYVFDEGHHLFEAADNAFAGHLTALETAELRRWIVGPESGRMSRARGLKRRLEDLLAGDEEAAAHLEEAVRMAHALPGDGWPQRLATAPTGPAEAYLALVRRQVYARAAGADGPYGLETEAAAPVDGLLAAGAALRGALDGLRRPLLGLARALAQRLDREAEHLDANTRQRLDAAARGLDRRARTEVAGWIDMLDTLGKATPPAFVDWFGVERIDGRDIDVGHYRHWVDPTVPFAAAVAGHAHGMLVTSATLTDGTGDAEADWQVAEARTGAVHLARPAVRARVPSPFDYPRLTRVFVVRDVRKDDLDQVAGAYRELFLAAGGGGLGLFTAVSRLKAVHGRIAAPLEAAGIPLCAQHVDGMDVATLVEIFRGEEDACLLGTDAVRDGVDVPGASLRLIVFDRVPWPRPDILHRARREAFGTRRYDDMLTRLRLRQAFGRLVRRADDMGVFVLLDPMMPSRLAGAFPEGVAIERTGLAEAVAATREFLRAGEAED